MRSENHISQTKPDESSEMDDHVESNGNGNRRHSLKRQSSQTYRANCFAESSDEDADCFQPSDEDPLSSEEEDDTFQPGRRRSAKPTSVLRQVKGQKLIVGATDRLVSVPKSMAIVVEKIVKFPSVPSGARPAAPAKKHVFSDDLSNVCRTRCEICSLELNYDMIEEHLSSVHSLTHSEYKKTHEIKVIKEVFHKCCKCGSVLQLTKSFLKTHLSNKHNMNFKSYEKELAKTVKRKESPELVEPSPKRIKSSRNPTAEENSEVIVKENDDDNHVCKLEVDEDASTPSVVEFEENFNYPCKLEDDEEESLPLELEEVIDSSLPLELEVTEEPTLPLELEVTEEPTLPLELEVTEEPTLPLELEVTEEPRPLPHIYSDEADTAACQLDMSVEVTPMSGMELGKTDNYLCKLEVSGEESPPPKKASRRASRKAGIYKRKLKGSEAASPSAELVFEKADHSTLEDLTMEEKAGNLRFTNVAYDYSSFKCHECDFVGIYRNFRRHILSKHNQTTEQYREKHGHYQYGDKVLHNCTICGKCFVFSADNLYTHLRLYHSKMPTKTYIKNNLDAPTETSKIITNYKIRKSKNKDDNLETEPLPEEDILAIEDNYVKKETLKNDYQSVDKDEYLEEEPENEDAFANEAFVTEAEDVKDELTSDSEEFDMINPEEFLEKDSEEFDFINPNEYLLMDNERYSDVLDDYCSYQCAECDYSGRYRNLGRHITNTHKMDKNEYKAKHGEFKFKDKVLHHCKICGDTILYNYDNVLGHVRTKHKETMLFYKNNYLAVRYSDIPYDYSIFNCHECDFSGSDILDHIKKIHNLTSEEYWCKHGDFMFEEKILHECKICGEEFIYSVHGLSEHCSQQYHVHQEKYIADFLNHTLDKEDSQGDGVRNNTIKYIKSKKCYSKKCDKSTHMFFNTETGVRNHNEKFECEEKSTIKTEMGNKKETILTSQLSADKESPSNKVKKGAETVEVPWYNGNTYCCRQCSFDSHCLQSTEDHVRNQHALQSLKKVRKGYTCMGNTHVCRFCEQEVPHEKMAIQDHLEDHCLSLEDYERLYINNTSLLLKKEHVKPTHEDSVSEDTSPSQETLKCATHFLAEEDSPPGGSKREKKYLEQAKLTAHRSNHRREKEYKCEGCDESYRKKRLAKHCKKSHLGQFLYKCTSLEYRTDNKDHLSRHVDSHFKVTDMSCRVQEPEPEIKDDHIYICPLCQYQTKIQGLKDGTGSTHLLEKHQLTFKHFKKSGHRWRKVTLEDAISVLHNILS